MEKKRLSPIRLPPLNSEQALQEGVEQRRGETHTMTSPSYQHGQAYINHSYGSQPYHWYSEPPTHHHQPRYGWNTSPLPSLPPQQRLPPPFRMHLGNGYSVFNQNGLVSPYTGGFPSTNHSELPSPFQSAMSSGMSTPKVQLQRENTKEEIRKERNRACSGRARARYFNGITALDEKIASLEGDEEEKQAQRERNRLAQQKSRAKKEERMSSKKEEYAHLLNINQQLHEDLETQRRKEIDKAQEQEAIRQIILREVKGYMEEVNSCIKKISDETVPEEDKEIQRKIVIGNQELIIKRLLVASGIGDLLKTHQTSSINDVEDSNLVSN